MYEYCFLMDSGEEVIVFAHNDHDAARQIDLTKVRSVVRDYID